MATTDIKIHPAAAMFPMIEGEAYRAFVEDINKHGQQQPIALLPDGSIIDGRNRLRACEELGVEPWFVSVDPESPLAYVLSANKHRRHLTSSQLAALAVEDLPKFKTESKERLVAGQRKGGQTAGRSRPNSSPEKIPESNRSKGEARERAAKAFGTNANYVQTAQRIKADAPDLFEKVKSGEMSLTAAGGEAAKRTGKRADIVANAAFNRAADFVGRIEGVVGYCKKVSAAAIKRDERLRRHWKEACGNAIKALRELLRQLEEG